ncbi:hypothetical protein SAMN05660691_00250 [Rheinheimera pacifica]|uniref:Uncharacterized protein n=1 Tax=Rheinheimera pacifica TaxID=173990 RepID=A0A1H6JCM8_9GAMM|nr:hypothetical protein [Rheinheimera pacifica]SEH57374.1 hypothetical protein SAMN05660691_00250 [Rheinheimera pacifica]
MTDKKLLLQRFDAIKVANFNESLRLEGLQPNKNKAVLNPKLVAKLKELQRLNG